MASISVSILRSWARRPWYRTIGVPSPTPIASASNVGLGAGTSQRGGQLCTTTIRRGDSRPFRMSATASLTVTTRSARRTDRRCESLDHRSQEARQAYRRPCLDKDIMHVVDEQRPIGHVATDGRKGREVMHMPDVRRAGDRSDFRPPGAQIANVSDVPVDPGSERTHAPSASRTDRLAGRSRDDGTGHGAHSNDLDVGRSPPRRHDASQAEDGHRVARGSQRGGLALDPAIERDIAVHDHRDGSSARHLNASSAEWTLGRSGPRRHPMDRRGPDRTIAANSSGRLARRRTRSLCILSPNRVTDGSLRPSSRTTKDVMNDSLVGKIMNRVFADFVMPSRLHEYRGLLQGALDAGYVITSIEQFWRSKAGPGPTPSNPFLILRHDVDTDPGTARKMFLIERDLSVVSSYYFRLSTIDARLMSEILDHGGEASYHYEELATVAKRRRPVTPPQPSHSSPRPRTCSQKTSNGFDRKRVPWRRSSLPTAIS